MPGCLAQLSPANHLISGVLTADQTYKPEETTRRQKMEKLMIKYLIIALPLVSLSLVSCNGPFILEHKKATINRHKFGAERNFRLHHYLQPRICIAQRGMALLVLSGMIFISQWVDYSHYIAYKYYLKHYDYCAAASVTAAALSAAILASIIYITILQCK